MLSCIYKNLLIKKQQKERNSDYTQHLIKVIVVDLGNAAEVELD